MKNNELQIGSVITARVIGIYNHFVELSSLQDDRYIGSIHISKVSTVFVNDLANWFYPGQILNVLVEEWDEGYGYQFRFKGIRQPNGLKTNTVVQARVLDPIDGSEKYKCDFVDFDADGVLGGLPKGYLPHGTLPVKVYDIRKNLILCKV